MKLIQKYTHLLLTFIFLVSGHYSTKACSPLTTPVLTGTAMVGNNLLLNMNSVTIYNCTYSLQIELTCIGNAFTGAGPFFYTSPGYSKTATPFAITQMTIPVAALCQGGVYHYRWREQFGAATFSGWSTEQSFTMPGVPIPANLTLNATPAVICYTQTSQLTSLVTGGCGGVGGAAITYSWFPSTGLSCTNCANPIANPTVTTNYTCVANGSGIGSCWSVTNTINVNHIDGPPLTVNQPTICLGSPTTLTASGAFVSYTWSPSASGAQPSYNPALTTVYTVTGTTAGGCVTIKQTTIHVVQTSPVTVTLPNNICQGGKANISAAAVPAPLSYSWVGPNNFSSTASATSITNIQPNATGVYIASGTWAMGTHSCIVSGVNVISVVSVNSVNINAPITTCYPGNAPLTAYSPGAITYSWTGPSSFSSNIANPFLASPMPTYSGIYSVTTAYTDGILVCFNGNTTTVTINPILPFTLNPFKQTCFNANYLIAGPAGATTYTWIGPNGFTSNNQVLSIPAIQTNQSGDYFLTVNLGPCITSGSTKIEVISPIAFAQVPGNQTICKGDNIKLTLNSTGGSRNYAYDWNPAIYLTAPTGSLQNCKAENTTIYNVTGYDISCPDYKISTSVTVTVNKAPEPNLQLEKVEGCQPLCLQYNSKIPKGDALITYDFGDGNIMQSDDFPYCLNEPGTYNLKITTKGKNGCSATFAQQDPITVWPASHTEVTWTPDLPSTTNNHITFEPKSQNLPVKYEWNFQGASGMAPGAIDTSTFKNPSRYYDNVGKFPVMLVTTTDKGCKETIFKVLDIKDDFTIFIPNSFTPNGDGINDFFTIKGIGLRSDGHTMSIYDRWGVLIYNSKEVTKGWDGTSKGLLVENGVYVYKIKISGANGEGKKEYVGHVNLIK